MQYIIISDSHGNVNALERVIDRHPNTPVIFLGDGLRDIDTVERNHPDLTVLRVAGNNDFYAFNTKKDIIVPMRNNTLFCTHGHNYGVRNETDILVYFAKERGCTAALFGHTHIPVNEMADGILLLNPGSLGYGDTYALLTEGKGKLSAEIKRL